MDYLWAESGFLMEVAVHEVTVLSGSDFTPATRKDEFIVFFLWGVLVGLVRDGLVQVTPD